VSSYRLPGPYDDLFHQRWNCSEEDDRLTAIAEKSALGVPVGTWTVDPSNSEIEFSTRNMLMPMKGRFESFTGTIVTHDSPDQMPTVSGTVDLNSINTDNAVRDALLHSADVFNTSECGPMTFTSTDLSPGGKGFLLTGDLTINGVTEPVTFDVDFLGHDTTPDEDERLRFEATTEVSRKNWDVGFNVPLEGDRMLVGENIRVTANINAVLTEHQPDPQDTG
jgi:polyisoprenoid-binding protein YceI